MKERLGLVAEYSDDMAAVERYRLPRVMPGNTLRLISQRLLYLCDVRPEYATHYVAIASSGNSIAAGAAFFQEMIQPFAMTYYSTINLAKANNLIFSPDTDETPLRTILVDNSIKTGDTVHSALSLLATRDVSVDTVVSVVRYGTEQEAGVVHSIENEHRAGVVFLFDVSEVDAVADGGSW
jgi:hypothetical protein